MSVYTLIDLTSAVCRFCLNVNHKLTSIFEEIHGDSSISCKVSELLGYEVEDEEDLPNKTCSKCLLQIEKFIKFKEMALQSHTTLKERGLLILKKVEDDENTAKILIENKIIPVTPSKDLPKQCMSEVENHLKEIDKETENRRPEYPTLIKALKNDQCLLCLEQLAGSDSLHAHVDTHVAGTALDPYYNVGEKNIYCRVCEKHYDYRFSFIEHQRQHLNIKPFSCTSPGCSLAFHSRSTLKQHEPLHACRRFICAKCGLGFKRQSDRRTHEIIHQDEGREHTCSICSKQFKNRITLRAHYRGHVNRPKHKCPQCPKVYYSQSELSRHTPSHSEEKMFSCATCSRSYFSKSALNRHLRESCNWTKK